MTNAELIRTAREAQYADHEYWCACPYWTSNERPEPCWIHGEQRLRELFGELADALEAAEKRIAAAEEFKCWGDFDACACDVHCAKDLVLPEREK